MDSLFSSAVSARFRAFALRTASGGQLRTESSKGYTQKSVK